MAYCSNCGRDISPSAVACPNCGHPGGGARGAARQVVHAPVVAGPRRTEGFAVASLVCSVAGFVFIPFIGPILGIIFGGIAKRNLAADPALDGEGMARAGVIIGWVGLGMAVVGLIFFLIVVAVVHRGFDGFQAVVPLLF